MIIRVVQAIGGGEVSVDCEKSDLISSVKQKVAKQKKIPERSIILIYNGRQLDESLTLKETEIEDQDKLYMITRTTGG